MPEPTQQEAYGFLLASSRLALSEINNLQLFATEIPAAAAKSAAHWAFVAFPYLRENKTNAL